MKWFSRLIGRIVGFFLIAPPAAKGKMTSSEKPKSGIDPTLNGKMPSPGSVDTLTGFTGHNYKYSSNGSSLEGFVSLFDELVQKIRTELFCSIESSELYQKGVMDGYHLLADTTVVVKMITHRYETFIDQLDQHLNDLRKNEQEMASSKIKSLQKKLDQLEKDLDPEEFSSIAAEVRTRLSEMEDQLQAFLKTLDHTDFVKEQKKFWNEYLEREMEIINLNYQGGKTWLEALNVEIESLKKLIVDFFNANGGTPRSQQEPRIQELLKQLEGFPILNRMLNDGKIFNGKKQQKNSVKDWFFDVYKETPFLTQSQEAVLEVSTTKLQKVRSAILEEQPVISGKRQAALYFFLAFLIFFGEFYLVYNFLADILGFSLTGDNEFSLKKEWPRVLFSIIYPIGIGMFFEIAFTKANRAGQLRKTVYRTGLWVILIAILLISIPNAINLIKKTNNYPLEEYFNNSEFFTAMSGFSLIIFLASITLLLAITGASVLHEAIKMSRRHFHLNGGLLKKLEKNGHYQSILQQMEQQKEKLVDLEKQKKTLLSELAAAESNSKLYERTIDLLKSKESFKNTAKFLYLSGYEEGRSLKLSRMPEDEFLIYSYKVNFNKPDYPEN